MSIGMMLKCMCRSTNRYWLGSLHKWRLPESPAGAVAGAAQARRRRSTLGRRLERGVAWEEIRLLTLLPKTHEGEAGRSLQRIVLEVFPKTYFIRTITLYEVSGNVANFEFSSLQSNVGLDDSFFDLKLPADVEVVKAPVSQSHSDPGDVAS